VDTAGQKKLRRLGKEMGMSKHKEYVDCYATFSQNIDGSWQVWTWETMPNSDSDNTYKLLIPVPEELCAKKLEGEVEVKKS